MLVSRTAMRFVFGGREQALPLGAKLRERPPWQAEAIGDRNALKALMAWVEAEVPESKLIGFMWGGITRVAVVGLTVEQGAGPRKPRRMLRRS